jgi:hypothetical protein
VGRIDPMDPMDPMDPASIMCPRYPSGAADGEDGQAA